MKTFESGFWKGVLWTNVQLGVLVTCTLCTHQWNRFEMRFLDMGELRFESSSEHILDNMIYTTFLIPQLSWLPLSTGTHLLPSCTVPFHHCVESKFSKKTLKLFKYSKFFFFFYLLSLWLSTKIWNRKQPIMIMWTKKKEKIKIKKIEGNCSSPLFWPTGWIKMTCKKKKKEGSEELFL